MSNEEKLLIALFLASALNDKLDDITQTNAYVREFKRETKRYLKVLEKKTHELLNDSYGIDADTFETLDTAISKKANEMAKLTINELFIIKD